ncbi:MAG: hypothetical protein FRX49_12958 [Trebouxia sp. A1-2]|nr:MAG: hypothetical protein FRX49_12958 [Trebouxia sp. A1-2]
MYRQAHESEISYVLGDQDRKCQGIHSVKPGMTECMGEYSRVCQGYGRAYGTVRKGVGVTGCMAEYAAGLYSRAIWQGRDSAALCINKAKRPTPVKGRHAVRDSAYPLPQSISSNTAGVSSSAAAATTSIATAAASYTD